MGGKSTTLEIKKIKAYNFGLMNNEIEKPTIMQSVLSGMAEKIADHPNVELHGLQNVELAQEWMAQGGSVLLYSPHRTGGDPGYLCQKLILPYFEPKKFVWIATAKASKEISEELGIKPYILPQREMTLGYPKRMDFELLFVAQRYLRDEMNDENKHYADSLSLSTMKSSINILKKDGGLVVIFPEGTRSKNGLLRAEQGMELLLKKAPNAIALPVDLDSVGTKISVGSFFDVCSTIKISVGEPIDYQMAKKIAESHQWKDEERGEFSVCDALMLKLSEIVVSEKRGVYSFENIREKNK